MFEVPGHADVFPLIIPGCTGADPLAETIIVLEVLVPQLLTALTDIAPPVVPELTVMEFVEEVPYHPDGNVQL